MGNIKTGIIGIGVIFLISIIVVVIWNVYDMTNPEYKQVYREEQKAAEQAEKLVLDHFKEYKGKDNSGNTVLETLSVLINISYPDMDIFEHPSTTIDLYVLGDDPYWEIEKKEQYDIVVFYMKTYKEEIEYQFIVDIENGEIFGRDQTSENLLYIVDTFD